MSNAREAREIRREDFEAAVEEFDTVTPGLDYLQRQAAEIWMRSRIKSVPSWYHIRYKGGSNRRDGGCPVGCWDIYNHAVHVHRCFSHEEAHRRLVDYVRNFPRLTALCRYCGEPSNWNPWMEYHGKRKDLHYCCTLCARNKWDGSGRYPWEPAGYIPPNPYRPRHPRRWNV